MRQGPAKLMQKLRAVVGVLLKDWLRYRNALAAAQPRYLSLCNRYEDLEVAPNGMGYRCQWQWTSDLHAPKILPHLGRRLMRRSLSDHPIRRAPAPLVVASGEPDITFLIGHRGKDRLPHLLATLETIAAQQGAEVECIVVEQDTHSRLRPYLPPWVHLIHTPPPTPHMPYCRSWAFNVAARNARAAVLVLHDNDMLVPIDYSAQILRRVSQGYDVVNLKRFIFYLTQAHTDAFFDGTAELLDSAPEVIVQNLEGGGSVGIARDAFDQIGGMDESFVGWGGEDNELWERAQTLRTWFWGNLSLVHLSHPSQPGKRDAQYPTAVRYGQLAQVDPPERITRLTGSSRGGMQGPVGWSDAMAHH